MRKHIWSLGVRAVALGVALGSVACDSAEPTALRLEPVLVPSFEASQEDGEKVTEESYSGATKAAAWIGSSGGSLSLAGHSLVVPKGAVSRSMCFTVELGTGDYVDVDLHAWLMESSEGCQVEEGGEEKGWEGTLWTDYFEVPVQLSLTYSRANSVSDPSVLVVAWEKSSLEMDLLDSWVDQTAETVSAELDHFSRYTLAYPAD